MSDNEHVNDEVDEDVDEDDEEFEEELEDEVDDDEEDDDEEIELVCMPIFTQFKPETLREMVAQPWDAGDGNLTLMRINDQWEGTVCPIAFCLYKEGKAWLTDRDGGFAFQSTPDGDHIARQLMGLARSDLVPAVRLDEYSRLVVEASDFYTTWDDHAPKIDLAKAACLDLPETVWRDE